MKVAFHSKVRIFAFRRKLHHLRAHSKNSRKFSFWGFPTTATKDLFCPTNSKLLLEMKIITLWNNEGKFILERNGKIIINFAVLDKHILFQFSEARKM